MKLNTYNIFVALLAFGLLGGCSPVRTVGISVLPDSEVLTPDHSGAGTLKMKFRVPMDYLSKQGRLLITPRLVSASGEVMEI